jgi:hypothetical protein
MPTTLDAIVLLGQMEREQAIPFLKNDCYFEPQLTDDQIDDLWNQHRNRALQLPIRTASPPRTYQLSADEQRHANRFLAFMHQAGVSDVQQVLKLDIRKLAVHQYYVVTERSEGYRLRCADPPAWMEECLPTAFTNPQVRFTFTRQNLDSNADFELPHAEFFFGPNSNGTFGPVQFTRHVTVMNLGARMLLWAGYHRSYARVLSTPPAATEWPALVALTSNTIASPLGQTGVAPQLAVSDFNVFGRRAALFEDFFVDDLFMRVKLRKKRYQLQVRSKLAALNVD